MLAVVKLGGSAITVKKRPFTPRPRVIRKAAKELKRFVGEGNSLVLVHGGGSYGHVAAARFVDEGRVSGGAEALVRIRDAMLRLNSLVTRHLMYEGLAPYPINPSSSTLLRSGRIVSFPTTLVERALQLGWVPVTHGDVVLEEERGLAILSGDDIVEYLATELGAEVAVFVMGSGGVFTEDPEKSPRAVLLEEVGPGFVARGAGGADVTGGLGRKLSVAARLAQEGVRVCLGGVGELYRMLSGDKGRYTVFRT